MVRIEQDFPARHVYGVRISCHRGSKSYCFYKRNITIVWRDKLEETKEASAELRQSHVNVC